MEIVKAHVCPTCGAGLQIDSERQLYKCPYCGITFDYEYFREDDVLTKAESAMRSGEFVSALSAYEFMLSKDPHSFDALLGVILTKLKAKSVNELRNPEIYLDKNFPKINAEVSAALEKCLPEDRSYFEMIRGLIEKGSSYKDNSDEIKALRNERESTQSDIKKLEHEAKSRMPKYMSRDTMEVIPYHPKKGLIFTGSIYAAILIIAGFATYLNREQMTFFWTVFILATVPALIFGIFYIKKFLSVNEVTVKQKALIKHSWELDSQIKDRRTECNNLEKDIEHLHSELLRIKRP